jgi:Fe2+ or Zn2+ uptake regulation protein
MARRPQISPAVLDLMRRRGRHGWTFEDLQAGLAREGRHADFSTIYRAVEKLVAVGAAHKVLLDDGRARFELADEHHDHFHCIKCGELIAVPCLINDDALAATGAKLGAAVLGHTVVLSGFCRKCTP